MRDYTVVTEVTFDDSPANIKLMRRAIARRLGCPVSKVPNDADALIALAVREEHSILVTAGANVTVKTVDRS